MTPEPSRVPTRSSPLGFPLRIALRTLRELSHWKLLYWIPKAENAMREKEWADLSGTAIDSILVVQLADIGDLILTSIFLRELRGLFPSARITLAVTPLTESYARLCPHVDEVGVFDFKKLAGPRWKEYLNGCNRWWTEGRKFRSAYFPKLPPDLAISVRTHRDSVQAASQILLTTCHARQRIGYSLKPLLGCLRSTYLLDRALPPKNSGHEVERQQALLSVLGSEKTNLMKPELWSNEETLLKAEKAWRKIRAKGGDCFIGLGIGAGRPEKCWPSDRFAELAKCLESTPGWVPLIFGSSTDRAQAELMISSAGLTRTLNLAGELPLEVTAAVFMKLDFFIGNDSGPVHLAASAGIPVISFFGAEDPDRWGPWPPGPGNLTLIAPGKELENLRVEKVVETFMEFHKAFAKPSQTF